MAKKKEKKEQISSDTISSEIQKYAEDIGALRDEYKQCYETMKDIEKQITIKAGAIAALKALIETTDESDAENTDGASI